MLSEKDTALIYETILASPGMSDEVKVPLKILRKNVLVLTKVIELGLMAKNASEPDGIFKVVNNATLEEVKGIALDILAKSGLTEMYEKLNSLKSK